MNETYEKSIKDAKYQNRDSQNENLKLKKNKTRENSCV